VSAAGSLSAAARESLRGIARGSVECAARGREWDAPPDVPPELERPAGAFVSLKRRGRLRGCIGRVAADLPLWRAVAEVARAAAIDDPRFSPLGPDELDDTEIEVSVLGPLRRVAAPAEITIGADGLLIRKEGRAGLLLPQVARELGLDVERFLDETCLKAGLPRGAWREGAEILAFNAEVF
jgi:AmmeMemoRadiSam system protein A